MTDPVPRVARVGDTSGWQNIVVYDLRKGRDLDNVIAYDLNKNEMTLLEFVDGDERHVTYTDVQIEPRWRR